jgi:hypothetical protein
MLFARASIEFSTNSAIAFKGLLCESAMIRMAFQSSPIRSFPLSFTLIFMRIYDTAKALFNVGAVNLELLGLAVDWIETL